MQAIKPCPFCGNIPTVIAPLPLARRYHSANFCVWCMYCDTYHGFDKLFGGQFNTVIEAINSWNTRITEGDKS